MLYEREVLQRCFLFTEKKRIKDSFRSFQFHFTKYSHERKLYPLYFPLAMITLTMYIWFGGTVTVDEAHYACTLKVTDSDEKILYRLEGQVSGKKEINIYSDERVLPSSAEIIT